MRNEAGVSRGADRRHFGRGVRVRAPADAHEVGPAAEGDGQDERGRELRVNAGRPPGPACYATGMRILLVLAVSGCGSSGASSLGDYAVGTYIGGGAILTGSDDCTYQGGPTVFAPASATAAAGPRFITGPGRILVHCPKVELTAEAIEPTGIAIAGPAKVERGKSDLFTAHLVAGGGKELQGEASLDWKLGPDCAGRAAFSAVLGAQDTGGRDRHRTLEATAAGTCTVIATMTTGTALVESFRGKSFQAETLVTIE